MHELLAPVGNFEMLEAAINGGADAVYLAGPDYGARAEKANFSLDELARAVQYAHLMAVKVYVTVNTLIKQSECADCAAYLDKLVALGVDAVIAQDLFVIDYLQKHYPDFTVHGSTQMSIYNEKGLQNAKRLGLERVVLARELTLEQLKPLLQADLPEIEVFTHGAMCYAYSGACLLSSYNGGRSGNRGACAQSCRLNYQIEDQRGHLLSMRDLATIERIDALLKYPISTFKIEGRLRSADYVYHTVLAYRKAIDGIPHAALQPYINNMKSAFNRSYSSGYLWRDNKRLNTVQATNLGDYIGDVVGRSGKYHLKIKLANNLYIGDAIKFGNTDYAKGTEIFNIYKKRAKIDYGKAGEVININYRAAVSTGTAVYRTRSAHLTNLRVNQQSKKTLALDMALTIDDQFVVALTVTSLNDHVTVRQSGLAEAALNKPIDEESIKRQLSKLGDTPYRLNNYTILIEKPTFISKKVLNILRRQSIEALNKKRLARPVLPKQKAKTTALEQSRPRPKIICKIMTDVQYQLLRQYDVALYGNTLKHLDWQNVKHSWHPFSQYRDLPINRQMVSGLGQVDATKQSILDEHSQIYNIAAYDLMQRLNVDDITLSPEIEQIDALKLIKKRPFRIFGYGKLPLMYSATCPKKEAGQVCFNCSKTFIVKGEKVANMVVYCNDYTLGYFTDKPVINRWAWYNRDDINLLLSFTDEDAATTKRVIEDVLKLNVIKK